VPKANAKEGAIVQGAEVYGVESLNQLIAFLKSLEASLP
jgi:predicted ATPase with chaperone activity